MIGFSRGRFLVVLGLTVTLSGGLSYFEHDYKLFLADTLEAYGEENENVGVEMSVVTDLVIENVPVEENAVELENVPLEEQMDTPVVETIETIPEDVVFDPLILEKCRAMMQEAMPVASPVEPVPETAAEAAVAEEVASEPVLEPEAVMEPEVILEPEPAPQPEPTPEPVVESAPEPEPAPAFLADIEQIENQSFEFSTEPTFELTMADCEKYLQVEPILGEELLTETVPDGKIMPESLTEPSPQTLAIDSTVDLIEREFSVVDMNLEMQAKKLKEVRGELMANLISQYYSLEPDGSNPDFTSLSGGVYYLNFNLQDIWLDRIVKFQDNFVIMDSDDQYLEDSHLYFSDLIFSQNLDYASVRREAFSLQTSDGDILIPDKVFVFGKEAVLVYQSDVEPEVTLINFDGITPETIIPAQVNSELTGLYSLTSRNDDYKVLASEAKSQYGAYIDGDITFEATTLSFGEFNKYVGSDSTIAIKIGNTASLDERCAILVFGKEMRNTTSTIPMSKLSLVTKSAEGTPISSYVIKRFEKSTNKPFLGFTYIKDLEILEDAAALYLNLQVPAGLQAGLYKTDLSFEIFCPGA